VAGSARLRKAVSRNRAKRVLRAAFKEVALKKQLSSMDIILVALTDFKQIKSTRVIKDLMQK